MGEAARVLDDVSDRLGDVLRHADDLLATWSSFGTQVRTQVEHEAGAIGEVVEGAISRTASTSLDRAITDRLSALTTELGKLEQRARSASRAVAAHQQADRRVLWVIAAGVILANIVLAALWLRPAYIAPPAPDPVRVDRTALPFGGAAGGANPAVEVAPAAAAVPIAVPPIDAPAAESAGSSDAKPTPTVATPAPAAAKPAEPKGSGATHVVLPQKHADHAKQP